MDRKNPEETPVPLKKVAPPPRPVPPVSAAAPQTPASSKPGGISDEAMKDEIDMQLQHGQTGKIPPAAPAQQAIKHVWTRQDTYADLAFKYYGSIKEPYWRLIYNHNKDIIGNHPNDIRVGLEIEIPPLPDELKLKK